MFLASESGQEVNLGAAVPAPKYLEPIALGLIAEGLTFGSLPRPTCKLLWLLYG